MTRDEIVTALRCCAEKAGCNECPIGLDDPDCIEKMAGLAADLIENQQRHIEDSGCAPEEVLPKDKADEIALKLMRLADLESLCSYDRLRELAEADKDGRLGLLGE